MSNATIEITARAKALELAKTEITRQALDSGKIVHTGWSLGRDIAEQCGVNVADYFDANGNYLGQDDNGLEPTFEANTDAE